MIRFLVEKGANVNAKDKRGQTPLALAGRGNANRRSTVELLRKLGGDT